MSVRVSWSRMSELKTDLQRLPESLAIQGDRIAYGWANAAAIQIRTAYGQHAVTGNLRDHVSVQNESKGLHVKYQVKSTARHAWIFEHGTVARHYYTDKRGVKHDTGVMPAFNIYIPNIIRARASMEHDLLELMRREGLTVTISG